MFLLRKPILVLSESEGTKRLITRAPVTRSVVHRFIAGETRAQAVTAIRDLRGRGLQISLDHLGEDTTDRAAADTALRANLDVIADLVDEGLAPGSEVSIKLTALGQSLGTQDDGSTGRDIALAGARRIVDAAYGAGMRVTLDMEDHTTVDDTLEVLARLRADQPDVGVAIQAMLRRTAADLAELTGPGSRVRLVKGAYDENADVAFAGPDEVDIAYVRALKVLMNGQGYPMIGSHDPRIISIAVQLASDTHRAADAYEFQMLYGIRPDEQARLVRTGRTVRVYVPYGTDWYGYFTRRIAERPANLSFFLRAMLGHN